MEEGAKGRTGIEKEERRERGSLRVFQVIFDGKGMGILTTKGPLMVPAATIHERPS